MYKVKRKFGNIILSLIISGSIAHEISSTNVFDRLYQGWTTHAALSANSGSQFALVPTQIIISCPYRIERNRNSLIEN